MKAKEIHDLLLSLLVRGLGFWLLYLCLTGANLSDLEDSIYLTIHPDTSPHLDTTSHRVPDWWSLLFFLFQLAPVIYLILGAPPLLKWATRNRDSR